MHIIDLSHIIAPGMPVYPGTQPPVITTDCTLEKHGFMEKKIAFYSHTGTHMDAPAHLLENGPTLDQFPVSQFHGQAFLLRLDGRRTPEIGTSLLEPHAAAIRGSDFLLIQTGWNRLWGTPGYFEAFPVLTQTAADWIAGCGLKGVGIDAVSVDPVDTTEYAVHKRLLGSTMVIVENLANLDSIPADRFLFSCFPLRFEQADGSPVRAVAFVS